MPFVCWRSWILHLHIHLPLEEIAGIVHHDATATERVLGSTSAPTLSTVPVRVRPAPVTWALSPRCTEPMIGIEHMRHHPDLGQIGDGEDGRGAGLQQSGRG